MTKFSSVSIVFLVFRSVCCFSLFGFLSDSVSGNMSVSEKGYHRKAANLCKTGAVIL